MRWDWQQRDAWFPPVDGLPRPDWDAIGDWLEDDVDEADLPRAYDEVLTAWLERLGNALPEDYRVESSDHFVLLTAQDPRQSELLLAFAERARAKVEEGLRDMTERTAVGKDVIVVIEQEADFYRYASGYFPEEGEFAAMSGLFVPDAYGHFLLWNHDLEEMESVLAYHLAEAWLDTLPLPEWLARGLAITLESSILERDMEELDPGMKDAHLTYWGEEEIQAFWSGEAFGDVDGADLLSDSLALVLVTLMSEDPGRFKTFVREAHYEDAGESACETAYGQGLEVFVSGFLGEGQWAPDEEAIAEALGDDED